MDVKGEKSSYNFLIKES